jgi:CRP-like cAMP-binding protein
MKHADFLPILTADPWFGSMPSDHQALLLDYARLKHFANGGAIYRVGDPPDGMYGVVEGEVRFVSYRINQEDLASAVGVSRQTLSKILKKLEGTGMLRIRYGSIEVTDSQALRRVAYDELG